MRTLFQESYQWYLRGRFRRLSPDSRPRWGRLTAPAMLAHVADQLGIALGDIQPTDPRGLLRFWPVSLLLIYWLPWPKGPREAFTTGPAGWEANRARLLRLLDRFARAAPDAA